MKRTRDFTVPKLNKIECKLKEIGKDIMYYMIINERNERLFRAYVLY
ncbi:hypothetical protein YN1_8180 [Nanoarchaeota archaeon]